MKQTNFNFNSQLKFKSHLKIHPFQVFTKIQQAKPAYYSTLINKQLGYDTVLEVDHSGQTEKIKKCVCSARPNSELYKRFSHKFIQNLKEDVDQLYLFCGQQLLIRLETSIGTHSNPGLFLIMGLGLLDEKYKESHKKCDISYSFLEYREGQMYDLLNYTKIPLIPYKSTTHPAFQSFKEASFQVNTFNQFIRLFKIALFNNKQRDFKSQSNFLEQPYLKSTFIMKMQCKVYNEQDELIRHQNTVLIDLEPDSQKETSKEKVNGKSLLDHILAEINNANPNNKPMHYHLVSDNHLLLFINRFLNPFPLSKQKSCFEEEADKESNAWLNGQVTIINSMSANKNNLKENLSYLENILKMVDQNLEASMIKKMKQSPYCNQEYSTQCLTRILRSIQHRTYSSMRQFRQFRQWFLNEVKKWKTSLKDIHKVILLSLKDKIAKQFLVNQYLAHSLHLIGNCIKSDHFKDFYLAKSYLLLEREIKIKTEDIQHQIRLKDASFSEIQNRFNGIENKWSENIKKLKLKISNEHEIISKKAIKKGDGCQSIQKMALKNIKFQKVPINSNSSDESLNLLQDFISYLSQYVVNLWQSINFTNQRTIAEEIMLEDALMADEFEMQELIMKFIENISGIDQSTINLEQENNLYHQHQVSFFKSIHYQGLLGNLPNNFQGYSIAQRKILKVQEKQRKERPSEKGGLKLPHLSHKEIVIHGKIRLSELLLNPNSLKSLEPASQNIFS